MTRRQLRLPLPELRIGCSLPIRLEDGRPAMLIRLADGLHAYLDACPHRGSRLIADPAHDEREHRDPYLDATGGLILCHRHQACFEPQQGLCLSGPCTGQRLTALDVTIERPDGSPAQLVLKSRH
ncbi:Rieske (2Fe-2S) protein [Cobetia marina]